MPTYWDRYMVAIIENHKSGIARNKLLDGFYCIGMASITNSIEPVNNLFNTKKSTYQ